MRCVWCAGGAEGAEFVRAGSFCSSSFISFFYFFFSSSIDGSMDRIEKKNKKESVAEQHYVEVVYDVGCDKESVGRR